MDNIEYTIGFVLGIIVGTVATVQTIIVDKQPTETKHINLSLTGLKKQK